VLAYVDGINLLGDKIDDIKQLLIDISREAGPEGNMQKAKYILMSRHLNARQNHNIKIISRSCDNVAQFGYFG
jgi:hypothetical protein